jgi:nucleoside-diphosphate-sugar epimerase
MPPALKVLVSGAAGFIGGHHCKRLLQGSHHILCARILQSGTDLTCTICI